MLHDHADLLPEDQLSWPEFFWLFLRGPIILAGVLFWVAYSWEAGVMIWAKHQRGDYRAWIGGPSEVKSTPSPLQNHPLEDCSRSVLAFPKTSP
jgi:hypothetical protein